MGSLENAIRQRMPVSLGVDHSPETQNRWREDYVAQNGRVTTT